MTKWTADTIRRARKKENMTQGEMAFQLGCRQQTISEWELGMYTPKNAYQKLLNILFPAGPQPAPMKAEDEQTFK
jgi:DNA-binding transcriptional regulator YiaG